MVWSLSLNLNPGLFTQGSAFAQKEGTPLLLKVIGKVILEDENIFLVSAREKNYLLIGEHEDKLKDLEGQEITVIGRPKRSKRRIINGKEIRLIINVKEIREKE